MNVIPETPQNSLGNNGRSQRGFSLIEMLIVVCVILIVSAMAIIQYQPALLQFRANAGEAEVKGALRQGRETAVSERAPVLLTFGADAFGNSTVSLTQVSQTGVVAGAPFSTIPIQPGVNFGLTAGEPDTPDGFGKSSAIYFGGAAYAVGTILEFQSDGSFTNANGIPVNGTVFLTATRGNLVAGRALTILGTTGRIKSWSGTGPGWFQQ
ncbi:MAG: prepilin-type N-terminal cleavage/methylation domain-containing protein [Candidatus Acidiferrales bacterium]